VKRLHRRSQAGCALTPKYCATGCLILESTCTIVTVLHETWPSNVETTRRLVKTTSNAEKLTHAHPLSLHCLFYLTMSMQASDGRKELAEAFVAGPRVEGIPSVWRLCCPMLIVFLTGRVKPWGYIVKAQKLGVEDQETISMSMTSPMHHAPVMHPAFSHKRFSLPARLPVYSTSSTSAQRSALSTHPRKYSDSHSIALEV